MIPVIEALAVLAILWLVAFTAWWLIKPTDK
jgi:hypothetical protein